MASLSLPLPHQPPHRRRCDVTSDPIMRNIEIRIGFSVRVCRYTRGICSLSGTVRVNKCVNKLITICESTIPATGTLNSKYTRSGCGLYYVCMYVYMYKIHIMWSILRVCQFAYRKYMNILSSSM